MMTTTKRAAKGGEFGANGEWYEGGKFINTVAANRKKEGSSSRRTGKQEIAPYVWEVPPADGPQNSIYRQFAGTWGRIENGVAIFAYGADVERLACVLKYCGRTREEAQVILDQWNAGQRWR
jgi:hypothetical protein